MSKEQIYLTESELIILKRFLSTKRKLVSIMGDKEKYICESLAKKGYLKLMCHQGGVFLENTIGISKKNFYTDFYYTLIEYPEELVFESITSHHRWKLFDILRNKSDSKISYLENHNLKLKINKLSPKQLEYLLNKACALNAL